MLSIPWEQRKATYEFVIIGSGYGGSITAARISGALKQPHSVTILERGKEWAVGDFPHDVPGVLSNVRGDTNKHAARSLGCTERTIKAHRHMVMEKMQVQSLAELVSLAERIGVLSASGQTA